MTKQKDILKFEGSMANTCGAMVKGNVDIETIMKAAKEMGEPPVLEQILVNKFLPKGTIMVSPDVASFLMKKGK